MGYNQLRGNIRNAMVPMTVAEATDYAASFDHAESRGYAEEFAQELRDEADVSPDFNDDPNEWYDSTN